MQKNKTLVLGASENPARYSNLAVTKLIAHGYGVIAVGKKPGTIGNINIEIAPMHHDDVDTVTVYLNPQHQKPYYNYILSLHPRRIIFNPGAENEELTGLAVEQGINALEACTLVLLSTGQY